MTKLGDDAISREAVIEWLKAKDIIKMSSQEEMARKELKALPSVTQKPIECDDAISRKAVKSCNTCKHSDKPYSEEPCKHCCDDVAEKWESEDKE